MRQRFHPQRHCSARCLPRSGKSGRHGGGHGRSGHANGVRGARALRPRRRQRSGPSAHPWRCLPPGWPPWPYPLLRWQRRLPVPLRWRWILRRPDRSARRSDADGVHRCALHCVHPARGAGGCHGRPGGCRCRYPPPLRVAARCGSRCAVRPCGNRCGLRRNDLHRGCDAARRCGLHRTSRRGCRARPSARNDHCDRHVRHRCGCHCGCRHGRHDHCRDGCHRVPAWFREPVQRELRVRPRLLLRQSRTSA